jgi:hypothetical protein
MRHTAANTEASNVNCAIKYVQMLFITFGITTVLPYQENIQNGSKHKAGGAYNYHFALKG